MWTRQPASGARFITILEFSLSRHSLLRGVYSQPRELSIYVLSFVVILKRWFFKGLSLLTYALYDFPGQQPTCFRVDALPAMHNDKSVTSCRTCLTHTSASGRDSNSIPLLAPLSARLASKGSMRMTVFRPGVRPFSTFSISSVAFWGVSQMTTGISAKKQKPSQRSPTYSAKYMTTLQREEGIF